MDEWVELYNASDAPVDLGGWILDDSDDKGSSNPYLIPPGTIIPAKGRIVLFRSTTHITLNDEKETVRLLHPDGTQADRYRYKKTPGYDRSFSRRGDGAKKWVKKCAVTMGTPNCK
ncbi:MAG: lamin tail domain-containing protein [Chloroflexi bacterium]|nr:lamin tail domain-containing protein [Chloroflexota bacterium]